MTFKGRTYKITRYAFCHEKQMYLTNYRVYIPCTKSGLFGNYIDRTKPYYLSLNDAITAMNAHCSRRL